MPKNGKDKKQSQKKTPTGGDRRNRDSSSQDGDSQSDNQVTGTPNNNNDPLKQSLYQKFNFQQDQFPVGSGNS